MMKSNKSLVYSKSSTIQTKVGRAKSKSLPRAKIKTKGKGKINFFKLDLLPALRNNELLRQKSAEKILPQSYELDWTIDHHRMSRTYLVYGIIRRWEESLDDFPYIIPNDNILWSSYFIISGIGNVLKAK